MGKSCTGKYKICRKVLEIFSRSTFETSISDNIKQEEWLKLSINAFVNPFSTLLQVRSYMLSKPEIRNLVEKVIDEVIAVAEKEGYPIQKGKRLSER